MIYRDIHAARFLARPNRFIAQVELDGREETVHVKNTGRCKELLLPGCTVYLEGSANPARRLEDNAQVRPGDIVFRVNPDGAAAHVNIAMTTAHDQGGLPCIRTADGNVGGKVQWFDTVPNYPTRVNAEPRWPGESVRVIFTRYPE